MRVRLTTAVMMRGEVLSAGTVHHFDDPIARSLVERGCAVEIVAEARPAPERAEPLAPEPPRPQPSEQQHRRRRRR